MSSFLGLSCWGTYDVKLVLLPDIFGSSSYGQLMPVIRLLTGPAVGKGLIMLNDGVPLLPFDLGLAHSDSNLGLGWITFQLLGVLIPPFSFTLL